MTTDTLFGLVLLVAFLLSIGGVVLLLWLADRMKDKQYVVSQMKSKDDKEA